MLWAQSCYFCMQLMKTLTNMWRTSVLAILMSFCFTCNLAAQQVNWVDMNRALELAEKENKKIFIDMYTDWCGWCKKMDKSTFQKPDIATYINANFIPVKFNAEQRSDVTYRDKVYKYVNNGKRGYHELAVELSKNLGRLSFPTVIFLDERQHVIQPIPGFQDPKKFEVIMHFIGDDHFRSEPFKSFAASFKGNYN